MFCIVRSFIILSSQKFLIAWVKAHIYALPYTSNTVSDLNIIKISQLLTNKKIGTFFRTIVTNLKIYSIHWIVISKRKLSLDKISNPLSLKYIAVFL